MITLLIAGCTFIIGMMVGVVLSSYLEYAHQKTLNAAWDRAHDANWLRQLNERDRPCKSEKTNQ